MTKTEYSELHKILNNIWTQSLIHRENDEDSIDKKLEQLLINITENSQLGQLLLFLNNKSMNEVELIAFKRVFETLSQIINTNTETIRFDFIKHFLLNHSSDYVREMAIYSLWEINSSECKKVLSERLPNEKCKRIIRLTQMMCDYKK